MKKTLIIIIACAFVAAVVVLGVSRTRSTPTSTTITRSGTITCLPHKNNHQPHTLECAIGLKSAGSFYGLRNLPAHFMNSQAPITVTGTLSQPENDTYDTAGVIDIDTIR